MTANAARAARSERVPLAVLQAVDAAVRGRSGTRQRGDSGSWCFRCPLPGHADETPSATWDAGAGVWRCHACKRGGGAFELAELLGVPLPARTARTETAYDYRDAAGRLVFQVVRTEPGKDGAAKAFAQRRPDGAGGWMWKLTGCDAARGLVYRLPEVLAAIAAGREVLAVEGEKDVATAERLGFAATCNAGGAGAWFPAHAAHLRGARVVVVPDNDQKGEDHAQAVVASLRGVAVEVRVLRLPNLPPKGDLTDWAAARASAGLRPDAIAAELRELVAAAAGALAEPAAEPAEPQGTRAEPLREPVPGPRLRTLAVVLADPEAMRPPEPVLPWLAWRGRVTLFAGREKLGKSRLASDGAAAVAAGRRFLGRYTPRGRVLVALALGEEAVGDLARHLAAAGAPGELLILEDVTSAEQVAAAIEAERPALAVLDSLAGVAGSIAEPSSAAGWAPLLARLTASCRATGAALLILHHASKATGSYRDSTAIGAAVDVIAELVEVEGDENARDVRTRGRVACEPFRYRLTGSGFELVDESQAQTLAERVRVAAALPRTRNDLARAVGGRKASTLDTIRELLASGVLVEAGDGLIVANPRGNWPEPLGNHSATAWQATTPPTSEPGAIAAEPRQHTPEPVGNRPGTGTGTGCGSRPLSPTGREGVTGTTEPPALREVVDL